MRRCWSLGVAALGALAACSSESESGSPAAGAPARSAPPAPPPSDAGARSATPSPSDARATGARSGASDAGAADRASDLVDISAVDAAIRVDIRYATRNNFTGAAFYPVARCLLRRDAAERLARVQRRVAARGFGLAVWDCYRPFSVQRRLWQLVPDRRYVAEPVAAADGTPLQGSKHNRGAAVDVTLVRARGGPVEMPTEYDDFTPRAHRGDRRASQAARRHAALLEQAMAAEGFEPLPTEWWHFDAPGWERYPLGDQPLAGEPFTRPRAPGDAGAASGLP
ncbi:MAG TPA: M15 family metallopeptidase [Kofleriaceae bacterium]|nr:M15 family metallopeptidase [Kofleriaceae bacterium]